MDKVRWIRTLRFVSTMALMPNAVLVLFDETAGRPVAWWQVALCLAAIVSIAEPAIFKGMTWGASRAPAKEEEVSAPLNVRIECASGRVVRCGVLRDPEADLSGLKTWLVIPLENYHIRRGDTVKADAVPADAALFIPRQ